MGTTGHGCLVVDDSATSDPLLAAVQRAVASRSANLQCGFFFGATDSRFLRRLHNTTSAVKTAPIRVAGFSPIRDTPVLLHDHDEFLNRDIFLQGLCIYKDIVRDISSAITED